MKKSVIALIFTVLGALSVAMATSAGAPDAIQVEVKPSSFSVNQPVDVTIKAIKNNEIMKNYAGTIFLSLSGMVNGKDIAYMDDSYALPGQWIFDMTLTDQGVKNLSKGLTILKPGAFTLMAEDVFTSLTGGATVIVKGDTTVTSQSIQVLSPVSAVQLQSKTVDLLATAPTLPNTRMQIFLNDLLIKESTSNADGLLSDTIDGLKVGTNYIQIKAVALWGDVVGQSEKIVFTYAEQSEDLLKSITATPNQSLKLGDKVRFEVYVDESVSSARLLFTNGREYPLTKEKDWLYVSESMMTQTGDVGVSVSLSAGALLTKNYENMLSLQVQDSTQIGEVKIIAHQNLPGALQLDWQVLGASSQQYAIKYGIKSDDLQGLVVTTGQTALLSGFTYGKNYFFQVSAISSDALPVGLPSEVIEFTMPIATGTAPVLLALTGGLDVGHPSAPQLPTCVLKNIKVSTEKIGNKYYLVRKPAENVTKYLIYKSDYADGSNKTFLGETNLSRFEYPFDKTLEEDVFAYYTVEAICTDGQTMLIADAKKVQVGPLEDLLLIFATTSLIYLLYRLYYYAY